MSSESQLKIGQKVEITGKGVRGEIAYIGMTTFAAGKWAGVILSEPKGKNNGTLKGTAYFSCPENYGMFVRPTQLILLDDAGNPIEEQRETPSRSRLSSVRRKSPIKAPSSRLPPTRTMTPSNSSSRLSLAGSRQSLLGSRTQLTSGDRTTPLSQSTTEIVRKNDRRTTISPAETSASASKRESFVETGFLENLKPQFTAGQSITSPAISSQQSMEEKLNLLQLQQENEELRNQIKELNDKLEIQKSRRNDDKERLREFDKMKTQYEQLLEFKSRIMEAQSQLQRELQRSKQETKDAIDARDQHAEEMSELSENVELITLDKEMAEEKADTLQLELEATKERVEELTLDLDLIKAEMQNRIGDGTVNNESNAKEATSVGVTSYEFKQLEQQNTRLRETLVRLRDLSAHDKHEIQKIAKELETKKSEVAELHRTKEKLSSKIDELEAQIIDLHEQVDAALGADEMVEQLGEKKMELEDKVKLLEEEVAELEALEEVHEQLVESNHDLEMDLREELDMALAAKRDMLREKDAALETILDRDQTILKFRELVQKLNDQIQDLRERASSTNQSQNERIKANANNIVESIDFKQMFAESKAYTRAIDLQLRQIELSQANEHVRMLTAFMPETFMSRSGDHDAILVHLLISRIIFKADIIVGQARERFSSVTTVDRNGILQGHTVQQFAFKSRLLHHVHNLKGVLHQFIYGLNACTPEILLKAGESIPEMLAQEKIVDGMVDLLKVNQLDENSSTENMEKSIGFFNAMYSHIFSGDSTLMNEVQLVRDCVASIQSACDSINTDSAIIQTLIQAGDETSEIGLLLQYVLQNSDAVRQQLKLIKRRLPQDANIIKCNLSQKTIANIRQTNEQLGKAMTTLFIASKLVIQTIITAVAETTEDILTVSVSHTKIFELLSVACEKVYEQDDRGPEQNLKNVLAASNLDMAQLAQYLVDNEYEIMSVTASAAAAANNVIQKAPIVQRAQFIRKQLEETKALTAMVENREGEIKQLKLAAKVKQQELSEMQYRKDLAEKKLSVLQNDHETNTKSLQQKYDEVAELLKKKEKEFEESMDHLQNDIDSLETERISLRDKLKSFSSKKGDLKQSTAFDITARSPYIAQELSLLKKAFADERTERIKLQAAEMNKVLNSLTPIFVPQLKDNRILELEKDLIKVKYDYIMSLAKGAEFPQANTKASNIPKVLHDHQNKQIQMREEIMARVGNLASNVVDEYLQRKPHRVAKGEFAHFPTNEVTRALKTK